MGRQADIRQKALESICIAKVSTPFVLFTQLRNREKGREEGEEGGERRENTSLCQSPELGLSLAFAHNLFPYTQGLCRGEGWGFPFAVFQAGPINFKINLITLLLNIFKSKGET